MFYPSGDKFLWKRDLSSVPYDTVPVLKYISLYWGTAVPELKIDDLYLFLCNNQCRGFNELLSNTIPVTSVLDPKLFVSNTEPTCQNSLGSECSSPGSDKNRSRLTVTVFFSSIPGWIIFWMLLVIRFLRLRLRKAFLFFNIWNRYRGF
jgi:hypothetical protein